MYEGLIKFPPVVSEESSLVDISKEFGNTIGPFLGLPMLY